jgi:hypothetical protein
MFQLDPKTINVFIKKHEDFMETLSPNNLVSSANSYERALSYFPKRNAYEFKKDDDDESFKKFD